MSASSVATCGDTSEGSTAAKLEVASPKSPTRIFMSESKLYDGRFFTHPCSRLAHLILTDISNYIYGWENRIINTNENVSQLDISMKNGMGRHMTKGIDNL